ncbi:MAG: hypothetical protein NTV38_10405, partial [Chloroflexi bacterium]|nr:hypothetical protein [Chloroflexota bacterium]
GRHPCRRHRAYFPLPTTRRSGPSRNSGRSKVRTRSIDHSGSKYQQKAETAQALKKRILAAAQTSFLPEAERDILMEQLRKDLGIKNIDTTQTESLVIPTP